MYLEDDCIRLTENKMYCYCYYRPQRSCGQGNIFAPVCHSVHRGVVVSQKALSQIPPRPGTSPPPPDHAHHPPGPGTPPPKIKHPPDQAPPPQTRHPPDQAQPPDQAPPWTRHTPGKQTPAYSL